MIEPGVVATELPGHISHEQIRQGVEQLNSGQSAQQQWSRP